MEYLKKIIGPVVLLGIISSLTGAIYAQQQGVNERHEETISNLQKEKVDNETMQMLIKQQTIMIEMQQQNFDRLYQEIQELRREPN